MYLNATDLAQQLDELKVQKLGILSKIGASAMKTTSRVLIIGIGGMGLKTVVELKTQLQERIGKIDTNYIRFLSFDTAKDDVNAILKTNLFTKEEIQFLDNSSLARTLEVPVPNRPAYINDIMPDAVFDHVFTGDGCDQNRLAGRLSLMNQDLFNQIYSCISTQISRLQNFVNCNLEVYVIAGTGGGTGSGMIIDIPYIVRAVAQNLNVATRLKLKGNIYLPNVYYNNGGTDMECAMRNGYAALKEIDYYMTIRDNGEAFSTYYPAPLGSGITSSNERIFDDCTLIGGKSMAKYVFTTPYIEAVSVCAQNLINQITFVEGNAGGEENTSVSDYFSSASFHANSAGSLGTILAKKDNNSLSLWGNYNYMIIGASSLRFPADEIKNSFVGFIFDKINAKFKANLSVIDNIKKDVSELDKVVGPNTIINKATESVDERISSYMDDASLRWSREFVVQDQCDEALNSAVTNCLTKFKNAVNIDSYISSINRIAGDIFVDVNKGPLYLESVLTSQSAGGSSISGYYENLRGYAAKIAEIKGNFEEALAKYKKNREDKKKDLDRGGIILNRRTLVQDYKDITKKVFETKFKIALCDYLSMTFYKPINLGTGVAYQIKSSLDEKYLALIDVFRYIQGIIKKNAEEAEKLFSDNEDPRSIFSLTDTRLESLKNVTRQAASDGMYNLGDAGVDKFAAALLYQMVYGTTESGSNPWIVKTNLNYVYGVSECAEAFRNFIRDYNDDAFRTVLDSKFSDYLDKAYGRQNQNYKQSIATLLVNHMMTHSEPMFNMWEDFSTQIISELCYHYTILPMSMGDLNQDGTWAKLFNNEIGADDGIRSRERLYFTIDSDIMYSYTMFNLVPLWLHADLIDYEKSYYKNVSIGMHINENTAFLPPYTDYPPLFIQEEWFHATRGDSKYANNHELEYLQNLHEKFGRAVANGIIIKEPKYHINSFDYITEGTDEPTSEELAEFVKKYISYNSNSIDNDDGQSDVTGAYLLEKFSEITGIKRTVFYITEWNYYPNLTDEDAEKSLRKQMRGIKVLDQTLNLLDILIKMIKE